MAQSDDQELLARIQSLERFYRDIQNQCWEASVKWRFARKQRDVGGRKNWKDLSAMAGLIARDLSRLADTKRGAERPMITGLVASNMTVGFYDKPATKGGDA